MMRRVFRFFPFICILLMLGCSVSKNDTPATATGLPSPSPEAVVLATGRPSTPEPPAPTPEPTPPPEEVLRQIEELDRIDRDTAVLYAGSDRFLLHQFFQDPKASGASLDGPFRFEDAFRESFLAEADALADDLHQLDREVLGSSKTIVYDTLDRFLSLASEAFDNPYILDPLLDSGFLLSLPENLSLYQIENEEDMLFLIDTIQNLPSCVDGVISAENERISKGFPRSETRLAAAQDWCEEIIGEKGNAIAKAIKENINKADGISRKQKKSYTDQIPSLLKEHLIPSVTTLRDSIAAWKNQSRSSSAGAAEDSRKYYGAYLSWITQSEMPPEEIVRLLETAADDLLWTLSGSDTAKEAAFRGSRISSSISTLKRVAKEMADGVPESNVKLVKVSDKISGIMSKPYILKRPFLDADEKQSLYYSEDGGKEGLYPEIAMVYYPGEALLDSVGRASDQIGVFQKVYDYPCYRKGWAVYAAEQAIVRQNMFDVSDSLYAFSQELLYGTVIPSLADIQVNYFGYGRDQLQQYFHSLSLDLSYDDVASLYAESVDCPGKHLPEGYGYAFFCDTMKRMSSVLGERYRDSGVHARLLGLGPCGFDIIREVMDEWADGQIAG